MIGTHDLWPCFRNMGLLITWCILERVCWVRFPTFSTNLETQPDRRHLTPRCLVVAHHLLVGHDVGCRGGDRTPGESTVKGQLG